MSFAQKPLVWWSNNVANPSVLNSFLFQTIILLLLGFILLYSLYPRKTMDLLDAYNELPSFADIPLILRDQARSYARRVRMQSTLVLRPFATGNALTTRDRGMIPSSVRSLSSYWGTSTSSSETSLGNAEQPQVSLSDRLRGRGWNTIEDTASNQAPKVPGLINTGNFCFMNSVLQALASLPEFNTYLEAINEGDNTTPLTSALAELLRLLNTPHTFSTALHPDQVARALMHCDKSRLLATREQQDAQEFFCLLIDTLESEASRQWLLVNKPVGLEAITTIPPNDSTPPTSEATFSLKTMSTLNTHIPSPFEGLSANRMGCLKCKYVENIRHEKFGPMVLPLNMQRSTTLEECLREEFEMEVLEDVECQKCTLLAYRTGLARVVNTLSSSTSSSPELATALKDAEYRFEAIEQALASGKVEDPKLFAPAGGDKEIRKFVRRSPKTKHHMIARPPQLLAFHIQRSNFHNYTGRAMKNQAPVAFPLTLDMSDYVTTSTLSMDPEKPISEWKEGDERTVYRLRSVIVHYGLHHMGHYVAYRYAEGGWFRISDEDVESATIDEVLTEGARGVFMLMYELLQPVDNPTDMNERDVSLAPTMDTAETEPEGIEARAELEDDMDRLDSTELTISSEEHSLPSTARPSIQLDNVLPHQKHRPSLLELVESRLENNRISPSSSVTSTSEDSLTHPDEKSRSTSFSSIHSRPHTPLHASEAAGTTEIFVKTGSGKTLALYVDKTITVQQLKVKLEELEGIPHAEQRLYASTKQLRDEDPLSHYDVKTIQMNTNMNGGSSTCHAIESKVDRDFRLQHDLGSSEMAVLQ